MTISSMAQNTLEKTMMKLSSGKRINSAADDAAGLAIAEKMEKEIRGLDQGTDNTYDMQNLVKTAEGGLSAINDNLQRVRELSIQAANGIYSDEDKAIIQNEVSQVLEGVKGIANSVQFNKMNLLDGSFQNKHTASAADGSGATVSIPDMNALLEGLEDYDVTGSFDLSKLDSAITSVNSARAELGALSNRFDSTINSNTVTMLNQAAAKSRIADMDMAKGMMDLNKENVLNSARIFGQKQQMEQKKTGVLSLLS